jgi:hypothetical protein
MAGGPCARPVSAGLPQPPPQPAVAPAPPTRGRRSNGLPGGRRGKEFFFPKNIGKMLVQFLMKNVGSTFL